MVRWQGGDVRAVDEPGRLPRARTVLAVPSPRGGYVTAIDARRIGDAAMELGAGRRIKGERIDPAVGVVLATAVGDAVAEGEPLAEVHTNGRGADDSAIRLVLDAFEVGDTPPGPVPHVLEVVTG
jgi:thymidine phosphorylase